MSELLHYVENNPWWTLLYLVVSTSFARNLFEFSIKLVKRDRKILTITGGPGMGDQYEIESQTPTTLTLRKK